MQEKSAFSQEPATADNLEIFVNVLTQRDNEPKSISECFEARATVRSKDSVLTGSIHVTSLFDLKTNSVAYSAIYFNVTTGETIVIPTGTYRISNIVADTLDGEHRGISIRQINPVIDRNDMQFIVPGGSEDKCSMFSSSINILSFHTIKNTKHAIIKVKEREGEHKLTTYIIDISESGKLWLKSGAYYVKSIIPSNESKKLRGCVILVPDDKIKQ